GFFRVRNTQTREKAVRRRPSLGTWYRTIFPGRGALRPGQDRHHGLMRTTWSAFTTAPEEMTKLEPGIAMAPPIWPAAPRMPPTAVLQRSWPVEAKWIGFLPFVSTVVMVCDGLPHPRTAVTVTLCLPSGVAYSLVVTQPLAASPTMTTPAIL